MRWENLKQTAVLTFLCKHDLKKYSYVTCRGEQSPSKFDTYLRQVKSTFGWKADLNTLTARQLKSEVRHQKVNVFFFLKGEQTA